MSKPGDFIMSTEVATLRSDTLTPATATISVPGGHSVGPGAIVRWTADISAGGAGATLRTRMRPSVLNTWLPAMQLDLPRVGSGSIPYSLIAFAYVHAPGTVRCVVTIMNPYSEAVTTGAAESIDFSVSTFIPPFA